MTAAGSTDRAWEDDIVHSLKSMASEDVPSLEIILLDAVVEWLFSPANPGGEHGEEHAGHLISTLFSAIDAARSFQPRQQPEVTPQIANARSRIAEGAHELGNAGADGVSLTVSRLMPAIMAELQNNVGERAKQAHGVFVYLLYALSVGTRAEQDPSVMDGLVAAFAGWDSVLRAGYVVPWRQQRPDSEEPAQD